MSVAEGLYLTFWVLGGLALFLLGMNQMTEGLRGAVGERLREVLRRGTCQPSAALGLGTVLGFLAHSSATTVMTVGFLNAGLLSLSQSLPVFFGANIGTTLSMQLVSFRLTDYAYAAVAVGFFVRLVVPNPTVASCARALMGFGLLFWGMATMSGAIEPHREVLARYLTAVDGSTWQGMAYGILLATVITLIVQSSGAVIGMCFALASAGVLVSIEQVFPIVLGAHLGTPVTALAASIGAHRDARRGAVGNLLFNLINVALALLIAPLLLWGIPLLSGDLVHQIAHLHTAVMVIAAAVLMPFVAQYALMLQRLIPVQPDEARGSNLDYDLIPMPESSLRAAMRELGRSLDLSAASLAAVRQLLREYDAAVVRRVKRNEETINELKDAVSAYIRDMVDRYLSRRQALLAQYLVHIASDVERVGDHVDHMCDNVVEMHKHKSIEFDQELVAELERTLDAAMAVLDATRQSLNSDQPDYKVTAGHIQSRRDAFAELSSSIRQTVDQKVASHEVTAIVGLFFSDFGLSLDRLVRHCRMIAVEQQQPYFFLKDSKLNVIEPPLKQKRLPAKLLEVDNHKERSD